MATIPDINESDSNDFLFQCTRILGMLDSSPVPRRVQIVPLGIEYARLKAPILEWRADVVVAVEYSESTRDIPYIQRLLSELEANERIDLRLKTCDIFDLYDTLDTLTRAISEYPDDVVYVNLSAGSKITAIAGMIACMATDAHPIYARPDYEPEESRIPSEPRHEQVAETFELPRYPIERPSDTLLQFLSFITAETTERESGRYRGVSKKELIEFAREQDFAFVSESEATTEKGYYRILDTHVVVPAQEKGYVTVEKVGRTKFVSLTVDGENTLRAFRHFASE